jgi:hypothetical protein
MEAPQNRKFYGKMECLPLWPTYIGEKGRTLGKRCGIKARCYWEHPWGTHWELKGTCWEQRKNEKITLSVLSGFFDWVFFLFFVHFFALLSDLFLEKLWRFLIFQYNFNYR